MKLGSFGILTIVHAFLALLLIVELGLTGYVVGETNSFWWGRSPSSFNFMLFNTVWSILVLIYVAITPAVFPRIFFPIVSLGLLAVTALFWFAGSIAMAVRIGVPDCDGNNFCQSAQTGVAFGFFLWAGFTGLAIVEGLSFWRSRGNGAHADTRSKAPAGV